jgi:SsrA-binding protein
MRPERSREGKREETIRGIAKNRKAFHEYFVEERFEAGIALTGTEVKSLREGRANLTDGYVSVEGSEAWLFNVHISPYEAGSWNNPEPTRRRKLLLHKREILKVATKIQRSGATCVPLQLYFKGSKVKAEIALVTGKKLHDKRQTIKKRESDREARAAMKERRR